MIDEQIKLLRQIQHLVLIRDEDANVGKHDKTEELSMKMEAQIGALTPEASDLYRRLSAKNRIFMSPLAKGNCSACGLKIPTATLQHVLAKDVFVVCKNCGRIL